MNDVDMSKRAKKWLQSVVLEGEDVLVISNKGEIDFDEQGFDYTKVTNARLVIDGKTIPLEKINTWASLLRSVNNATKPYREPVDVAEDSFNSTIQEVIRKYGLTVNASFSTKLFTDSSYITSNTYLNNQNHKLEVWRGKKICAVFSNEVVIVLNALIMSSGVDDETVELFISYKRNSKQNDTEKEFVRSKLQLPEKITNIFNDNSIVCEELMYELDVLENYIGEAKSAIEMSLCTLFQIDRLKGYLIDILMKEGDK